MPVGPRPEPPRKPPKVPVISTNRVEVPPIPPKPPFHGRRGPGGPRPFGSQPLAMPEPTWPSLAPEEPLEQDHMVNSPQMAHTVPSYGNGLPYPVTSSLPEPFDMQDLQDSELPPHLVSPASSKSSTSPKRYSQPMGPDDPLERLQRLQSIPSLDYHAATNPPDSVNQDRFPSKGGERWVPDELLPPVRAPESPGKSRRDSGQVTFPLDLPQIPAAAPVRPKFSAEHLTVADFGWCEEMWSLSGLARWLRWLLATYDADVAPAAAVAALSKLFLYRVRGLEWPRAEALAASVLNSLTSQGFCMTSGSSLSLDATCSVSGVLPVLTGDGCYSLRLRTSYASKYACYSPRCLRESRKPSPGTLRCAGRALSAPSANALGDDAEKPPPEDLEMDWASYWGVEVDTSDPGDAIKRQYALHELIMSEESYVRDLETYVAVYGEGLKSPEAVAVMTGQDQFWNRVFGRIHAILHIQQPFVAQLRTRQHQQGPYVLTIADLVVAWAQDPATAQAYGAYADEYLWAEEHLRNELATSPRLQEWMTQVGRDERLGGTPHSFYFHRVLPRVARYRMLLEAVDKRTLSGDSEEEMLLHKASDAVVSLARLCDERVARQHKKLEMANLRAHIVFKNEAVTTDLGLGDRRRRLLRRGDMLRRGGYGAEWVPAHEWVNTHALLLDNFLVLCRLRDGPKGTAFYVTKPPVPLDLLVVESVIDEPVTRQGDELYPLRITHLGVGGYSHSLFVATKEERDGWASALIEAQRARAATAAARGMEPISLRFVSDRFAYPEADVPALPIVPTATALHRAIEGQPEPKPVVVRRRVSSVAVVGTLTFVATDLGVYVHHQDSDHEPPANSEWHRALDIPRVTAIHVVEALNVLIVVADRNLLWYALDQIVARGMGDRRIAMGRRLNQQKKVSAASTGLIHGRNVVFYIQPALGGSLGGSCLLKVVEPVRSRGTRPLRRVGHGLPALSACTDTFREFDRVSVGDAVGLTPFSTGVILHTRSAGFEWLTLDSKTPRTIPTTPMAGQKHRGRPLAVFPLGSSQLLLCYESCCVVCGTNGVQADAPTTWFLGRATAVTWLEPYLVVVSSELVEIRYAAQFPARLVQLVTGKDIALVGMRHLRLAHPWVPGRQLLVELVPQLPGSRDRQHQGYKGSHGSNMPLTHAVGRASAGSLNSMMSLSSSLSSIESVDSLSSSIPSSFDTLSSNPFSGG